MFDEHDDLRGQARPAALWVREDETHQPLRPASELGRTRGQRKWGREVRRLPFACKAIAFLTDVAGAR
jgi:hypothetical protein